MRIELPSLKNEPQFIENKRSLVLIGANGSGKTRMSIWISKNNPNLAIHRVSAQKSLNMPKSASTSSMEVAQNKLWYGITPQHTIVGEIEHANSISIYRWKNDPEVHLLNDFEYLMELLMTDLFQVTLESHNATMAGNTNHENLAKLHRVKQIWEEVIPHLTLNIKAGSIEVSDNEGNAYNGSQMSDGERSIFYFIGEVVSAPPNSLIIIDEPESHLHHAILTKLWNTIEFLREDCTFLYITHNLDFAYSRSDSQVIWVKDYKGSSWDYELLDSNNPPDPLKLQIFGSRQKILLIEGDSTKSIDAKLYPALYPEYNIIPLGSCDAVINSTKTYKNETLLGLHHVDVVGIIDRDRRNHCEIQRYRENNIYVPEVAEIENLFLLPEVIRIVAISLTLSDQAEAIISEVTTNVFKFLEQEKDIQALLFTKQAARNLVMQPLYATSSTIKEYLEVISSLPTTLSSIEETYENSIKEIETILAAQDYLGALQIINNKGLIPRSNICSLLGLGNKSDYINYVIRLLNSKNQNLIQAFKKHIPLE